jgi:protease PrsW
MRNTLDRPSLWRTELAQIIGLLVFVGIVELVISVANPRLDGISLVLVSVLLALVPAVLWLSIFYAQDRGEPEPKHYVLGVAFLGALLAAAVGQPLLNEFFRVSTWIGRDTLTEILGSILVVGFTQEFLKYAAVRYSIFYSGEFDQRIDGVVYGSAAGLGYAAALNIGMVISNGGVDLGVGVIRIVVTQMVHGALGGLIGYFLGRDKFDLDRAWWMPLGLAIAATLDGLFSWLSGEITQARATLTASGVITAGYNPWPALKLGAALAVVVLGAVFYLIRSDLRADSASPGPAAGVSTPLPATEA